MNEFFTNIVISNGYYVFAMFIVLLLVCHLLVFPRNLSKTAWKKVDYIWLGVAVLGLLTLASDVRVSTAESWVKIKQYQSVSSLRQFREFYSSPENTYLCMKFVKSEFSPNDFDERVRQFDLGCSWLKSVSEVLLKLNPEELPNLSMDDFPTRTFEKIELLKEVKDIEQRVKWYNESRDEAIDTKALLSKTDLERILFYFSPFFLCLALALRIAKVTGELKHEKGESRF